MLFNMDMGWYYVVVICVFIFIIVPHLVSAFFLSTHNIGYINPRLRGSDVPYKTGGVQNSESERERPMVLGAAVGF
jgi:hypothetical protein